MTRIRFGTDGWRDIIADNFTLPISGGGTGIASYMNSRQLGKRGVVIGYDNRFLSGNLRRRPAAFWPATASGCICLKDHPHPGNRLCGTLPPRRRRDNDNRKP